MAGAGRGDPRGEACSPGVPLEGQDGGSHGGCQGGPQGPRGGDECCEADWGLIGRGLSTSEFAGLRPEVRRMALIERSARFAAEFGRWKDTGRSGGIGYEHMRLLQSLNLGGPAIMREIGDNLQLTPRNMTAMVDQLEEAGLVVRRPHPADRRATLLELTAAGKETADQALLPRFIAMGQIFDQFTPGEQQRFYAALGRLIEVMHDGTTPC